MKLLHGDICSQILKAFYSTYTILPSRLDKSFYVNFLLIEMQSLGLKVESNKKHSVFYKENLIGDINLDIVVNNSLY